MAEHCRITLGRIDTERGHRTHNWSNNVFWLGSCVAFAKCGQCEVWTQILNSEKTVPW